jgi:hypothetical protein
MNHPQSNKSLQPANTAKNAHCNRLHSSHGYPRVVTQPESRQKAAHFLARQFRVNTLKAVTLLSLIGCSMVKNTRTVINKSRDYDFGFRLLAVFEPQFPLAVVQ